MARLPATQDQSSRLLEVVIDHMERGIHPNEVAKRLAKGDPAKRKRLRNRIRHMLLNDPRAKQELAGRVSVEMLMGLLPATEAMVKRASRGRIDAVKLLYEASGFHNPRVQHEHSGDIKITLDMPRPPRRVDDVDDDVVDGTVVE